MNAAPSNTPADTPKGDAPHEKTKWTDVAGLIVNLVIAAAAICSAWIFQGQLTQARKGNEFNRQQWLVQQRPWIGSGEIIFKQTPTFFVYPSNPIEGTQVNIALYIPLKNVGLSPALHVDTEIAATLTKTIAAPPTLDREMQFACSLTDKNAKNIGGVLFPNTAATRIERNISANVPLIKVAEIHRVWIAICVAYSDTTAVQPHHTKIWIASYPINAAPRKLGLQGPAVVYLPAISNWGLIRTEAD